VFRSIMLLVLPLSAGFLFAALIFFLAGGFVAFMFFESCATVFRPEVHAFVSFDAGLSKVPLVLRV
jgi:hypothetical protein